MVTTAARLAAAAAISMGIAGTGLAETSPKPGTTVPPKTLPVPQGGESMVINPTQAECKAGWRPGLRWTRQEFEKFCAQLHISK
jgi:hypothetical protein